MKTTSGFLSVASVVAILSRTSAGGYPRLDRRRGGMILCEPIACRTEDRHKEGIMRVSWLRGWKKGLIALALVPWPALAVDVTVSFVTERDGRTVPLQDVQALWRSPFGGWVTVTWPFGLKVDDRPIMEYKSSFDKLLDQAGLEPGAPADSRLSDMAGELLGEKKVEAGDLLTFTFDRSSTARVDVQPGEHAIMPGNLRFAVKADGSLETADKRLRIVRDGNRVEVLCHPVTVRAMAGERSVPFAIQLTCGQQDLLGGLTGPIQEFESKAKAGGASTEAQGFRGATLYVPASDAGSPYGVSGATFEVDLAGQVKTSDGKNLRVAGNGELHLLVGATGPSNLRPVGVRWFGAAKGVLVAAAESSVSSMAGSGSASLRVPVGGKTVVSFGPARGQAAVNVAVPATFDAWPFKALLFDAANSVCWLAESAQLAVRPGGEYACRISALTGKAPALKADLPVQFHSARGAGVAPEGVLSGKGDSTFAGVLPAAVERGLWRVVAGGGSPLAGQALGLVLVSGPAPVGSLSLYTYRNRGLFRQGDTIDLFWTLKGNAGVAAIPIRLKGQALECEVGRIKPVPSFDGKPASGHLQLDSAALAPGVYEVSGAGDGLACYAARFRVCQRDPVSDFETYSYVFGTVRPSGGLPLTAYYDAANLGDEPGLRPLMDGVRGGLDSAFAAYATVPEGPAIELCELLPDDEAAMMALAGMGARAVPGMPRMIHHEEWNPKHSLPGELTRMRRRLALFTQQYADVPGFDGVTLNWYATINGYWEESKPLDGHQAVRNAAAAKWIADMTAATVEEEEKKDPDPKRLEAVKKQAQFEFTSRVLPNAYGEYLRDAEVIRPGLTSHSGIPSFWLGGGSSYSPLAFATLSGRDSVDYTDYGISPWGNFRAPAFLAMGNEAGQKTRCCYATAGRHSRFITAFGAVGRGLDGISLNPEDPYSRGEDEALLRIFERFGSYFTSLDPLPDVAVYFSPLYPWPSQKSVVLHDLARLRRPGMLVSQEDVLAGRLDRYKVLVLAALGAEEPKPVFDAFARFASKGGVILKDKTCADGVPGRDLGFVYNKDQVHDGWGLAWPNGEWEFAHLWTNYLKTREKPLREAFAAIPGIPVSTSDREVLISPLAGRESICCFVMNETYVPMSVEGKWRQHAALPRRADLLVQDGWHVRDLLAGKACKLEKAAGGNRVAMEFSRVEGAVYLLTKQEPIAAIAKTERTGPASLRLTAWLAAAGDKAIPDPMPFEVALEGPGKSVLFHKYASLGPDRSVTVPVPALEKGATLTLVVRDLVLGSVNTQTVDPASVANLAAEVEDVVGRDAIREFLARRKGAVTILLDEQQQAYRAAADEVAAVLKKTGRDARVMVYDPADVRLLPLRWKWQEEDLHILDGVRKGSGIAWRVNLAPRRDLPKATFDDPTTGFAEYGPRTWFEGDVILFGASDTSLALEDLRPFLRRTVTADYPSAGGFFAQYLWDPFSGGYDGVYLGCRDAAGADAAVAFLAGLAGAADGARSATMDAAAPVVTRSKELAPLPDMIAGKVGTRVLDVAYAPGGNRIFATADSYGDSLFALNPAGEIVDKRPVQNRCGNSLWWRGGGVLAPVSDTQVHVRVGDSDYLLDLEKGYQARSVNPPHGLAGRFKVKIGGPTILKDAARGRTYLGGARLLRALDKTGRVAWTYDDAVARSSTDDMLYPRSVFVRAVTLDGRFLLAAAFGIEQDCYGIGSIRNPSLFCVDVTSGKVAWAQEGLLLNEGKVVPMEKRFLVVDDGGRLHLFGAETGQEQGSLRPVGGADWIVPLPGKDALLVVENNRFDENGPTALAYVRPLGAEPDVPLRVSGRVTDVAVAADGRKAVLATERGETACFSTSGERLWMAEVPCGGVVRLSPDGRTALVGTREGRLFFVDMESGKISRQVDLNPFNLTSGEQFVKQMNSIGSVPQEKDAAVPAEAPAGSYLASLDQEAVTFGANLIPAEAMLGALKKGALPAGDPAKAGYVAVLDKPTEFTLKVEPGRTYLVELLTGAAEAGKLTPQTRLEVSVTAAKSANLPCVARLPVGERLGRRRMAFRTDEQTEVTVSLRVVKPGTEGEGKNVKPTYAKTEPVDVPVLVGDVAVAAMKFAGANLVLDRGPATKTAPVGNLECEVKPWTGGNSTIRWQPYPAPQQSLRLTDGIIANQETAWTTAVKGPEVAYAEGVVKFKKPQTVNAIAIYEDNSGPIPTGQGVVEKTAMHFGLYVHSAKSGQWTRVGYAANNTDLVNVFTFPAADVDQVRYFWASRDLSIQTDGVVRSSEIEVYSSEDSTLLIDTEKPGDADDDLDIDL